MELGRPEYAARAITYLLPLPTPYDGFFACVSKNDSSNCFLFSFPKNVNMSVASCSPKFIS